MISSTEDIARIYSDVLLRQRQSKAPIKLTDEERFAVAVSHGVRFATELAEGDIAQAVTEPCAVSWTGKEFVVMVNGRGAAA